jgi:hypothetical protein
MFMTTRNTTDDDKNADKPEFGESTASTAAKDDEDWDVSVSLSFCHSNELLKAKARSGTSTHLQSKIEMPEQ